MTALAAPEPVLAHDSARLLAAPSPDLGTHVAVHGPLPAPAEHLLLAELDASGLTGRGGAGFPVARKLRAVAAYAAATPGTAAGRPLVVGNGAEGEPASVKDRHLLTTAPHLVLDGLQLAARTLGAVDAVLYVHPGPALDAVARALTERPTADRGAGWTAIRVVEAAGGFVSGQETSVVAALEGRPAVPRWSPRRVAESGVRGRPTLVQNVETLAHLALVARRGAGWFRSAGTADATGTFLATVHGGAGGARVWEVPHGLPVRDLLAVARVPAQTTAVLLGGYHGAWLRLPAGGGTPLTPRALHEAGGRLGAGVVMPLVPGDCGLAVTARIVRYLTGESARQCGPCRFGLPHLAALVDRLAAGDRDAGLPDAVRAAAGLVTGRGACHHPDGTAMLVASTLDAFADDVAAHRRGRCLTAVAA